MRCRGRIDYCAASGPRELSPNLILVTSEGRRQRLELASDELIRSLNFIPRINFRQLVVTAETIPIFFGGLSEREDHRERGLVREAASRSDFRGRSASNRGEGK
jgi:hypothetical protein